MVSKFPYRFQYLSEAIVVAGSLVVSTVAEADVELKGTISAELSLQEKQAEYIVQAENLGGTTVHSGFDYLQAMADQQTQVSFFGTGIFEQVAFSQLQENNGVIPGATSGTTGHSVVKLAKRDGQGDETSQVILTVDRELTTTIAGEASTVRDYFQVPATILGGKKWSDFTGGMEVQIALSPEGIKKANEALVASLQDTIKRVAEKALKEVSSKDPQLAALQGYTWKFTIPNVDLQGREIRGSWDHLFFGGPTGMIQISYELSRQEQPEAIKAAAPTLDAPAQQVMIIEPVN